MKDSFLSCACLVDAVQSSLLIKSRDQQASTSVLPAAIAVRVV